MPPEVQARVFEPFFTTKGVNKGSGLGLPQVYGLAQQSDGHVTIESAIGIGTTVTLLLPRASRSLDTPAEHEAIAKDTAADPLGRVLAVVADQGASLVSSELLPH